MFHLNKARITEGIDQSTERVKESLERELLLMGFDGGKLSAQNIEDLRNFIGGVVIKQIVDVVAEATKKKREVTQRSAA